MLGISLIKNTVRKPALTNNLAYLPRLPSINSFALSPTKYRTSKNSQILENIAPISTYIVPQKTTKQYSS